MMLGRSMDIFLLAKRGELVSENTIKYYAYWCKDFSRYVAELGVLDWQEVTAEHLQSYLYNELLTNRKVRKVTVHDSYRAIKAWNRYLKKKSYIPNCIADEIESPKQGKKIPRTFTAQEVQAMFKQCEGYSFTSKREKAMLTLLLGTGIRKSELCGLLLSDVDIENGIIKVTGKGDKQRIIPIGRKVVRALGEYRQIRDSKNFFIRSKYYFVNIHGARLSIPTVNSIFKRIKEKSGLQGERVSCHTWRHTFAKSYLMNGGDIFSLQKIMGHSDLTTTKRYLNLNEKEIQTQYDKFNPVDNLDWCL